MVRSPAVISTSLCAIGMPVSGPRRRARERASAARAAASAPSASTVMNALSDACAAPMRASASCASSTLDTVRDAQRLRELARRVFTSLDDLRHQVQSTGCRRRALLVQRAASVSVTRSSRSGSIASCAWAIGSTPVVSMASSASISAKIASSFTWTSRRRLGVDLDAREARDAVNFVRGRGHRVGVAAACRPRRARALRARKTTSNQSGRRAP